ncbi:MFS transporter [bacterium]|nr:MFS transporter [bacterium]
MAKAVITHSRAFAWRRFLNWFPMGLTYALLYMGRYNLTVSKNALGDLMTKEDFGIIFGIGTVTYAFAFLLNGPLVDKIGGRKGILIGALGSCLANLGMGLYLHHVLATGLADNHRIRTIFTLLYAVNMYFQSYGAVAIVKVNSYWFHVRERGGFSGIFGTMISSGIFLAFTVNGWILDAAAGAGPRADAAKWVFFTPAALLFLFFVIEYFLLRDKPSDAGHADFDTGDASSGESDVPVPLFHVIKRILTNPIILTVACIEFCTGVIRNGIMHWFPIYAKEIWVLPSHHWVRNGSWGQAWVVILLLAIAALFFWAGGRARGRRRAWLMVSGGLIFLTPFLQGGWGGILFVAGVIGANVAGWASDLFFQSRRAPVAGILYAVLAIASIGMFFTLGGTRPEVEWSGVDGLQSGDHILAVAATPGEAAARAVAEPCEDWSDVSRQVAAVPPAAISAGQWNPRKLMVTYDGSGIPEGVTHSTGVLHALVTRGGERVDVSFADPLPTMRAGDRRSVKAGPVLTLDPLWLCLIVFVMSIGVIGTHGLLSGTATMDFGGRRGAATAVGMIDGFVYLGTGVQSFALGYLTTRNWSMWPVFLFPFGIIGFLLLRRIWHAIPSGKKSGH